MEGKKEERKKGSKEDEKGRRGEGGEGMRMMKMKMKNMMVGMPMEEKGIWRRRRNPVIHPSSIIHHPSSIVNHHRKAESSSAESMGGRVDGMIDEIKNDR